MRTAAKTLRASTNSWTLSSVYAYSSSTLLRTPCCLLPSNAFLFDFDMARYTVVTVLRTRVDRRVHPFFRLLRYYGVLTPYSVRVLGIYVCMYGVHSTLRASPGFRVPT